MGADPLWLGGVAPSPTDPGHYEYDTGNVHIEGNTASGGAPQIIHIKTHHEPRPPPPPPTPQIIHIQTHRDAPQPPKMKNIEL